MVSIDEKQNARASLHKTFRHRLFQRENAATDSEPAAVQFILFLVELDRNPVYSPWTCKDRLASLDVVPP